MKRRMLALLLAVLMLAMLTAAAFAEDTVLGVYNVTGPLTVLNGTKNGSFYADANEFELNCSGLTGEYSLVLLLEGDSPVPTDGNIQYIDQMSIANGAVKFTLKPKAFKYGEKPLIELGDANNDGKVDTNDATAILLYVVNKYTMTDEQLMAADVNGDHTVNTNDAVAILLQIVGK